MIAYRSACMLLILIAAGSAAANAAPRDEVLSGYAASARKSDPAFAGFSATRGEAFYRRSFAGGKPETPACGSCHGDDPRQSGRTPSGKSIEPLAVSLNPSRFNDPAKVEKWFRRNCHDVLGRECSAQEKGDWLSHVFSR